jgi:hypothetical protein
MPNSSQPFIKSGHKVVDEFVDTLCAGESLDALTIASVGELHKTNKLTKTRLLQALEIDRSRPLSIPNTATK